jgi:hypothetical protein
MKPGPMALVAMRNTAPITAVRLNPDSPAVPVPVPVLAAGDPAGVSAGVFWVIPGQ